MTIHNNTNFVTKAIHSGQTAVHKKVPASAVSEVAPVTKKSKSADFSMILSDKQKDTLHQTLGYDKPGFKERGAVEAYTKVATQEKREAVMESMSFHFVV